VQTEVIRRAARALRRSQDASSGSGAALPPGTTSVSVSPARSSASPPPGTSVSPLDVVTGAPSRLAVVTR
jgi:hypothetical protein